MKRNAWANSAAGSLLFPERGHISWFSVLKQTGRSALHIDRSQITALQALRSTLGFVLPLALGVATGHVLVGVSIAAGAIGMGSIGLTYINKARIRTILLACVGIAVSVFVGAVTGRITLLAILVVGIWGFGAGMLACLAMPALMIGSQAVVALIILSHFALTPLQSAQQGALFFAGALFQALLALLFSPWQRGVAERNALAIVFQRLADYVVNPNVEASGEQLRDALMKAQLTLSESNDQSQQGKVFLALLAEAERIRLTGLILYKLRKSVIGNKEDWKRYTTYLEQITQLVAEELREIVRELKLVDKDSRHIKSYKELKDTLSALQQIRAAIADDEKLLQDILKYCDMLRSQLRHAKKLAQGRKYTHRHLSLQMMSSQVVLPLHNAWAILHANLTLHSSAFRHAIRLGVTLALATAFYRLLSLSAVRGYWIPLTMVLVLRPDFNTTFTRGVARMLGTVMGVAITTILVSLLAPAPAVVVVIDAIVAYLAFSFLFANYMIFSVFVTVEVVFLLSFVVTQPLMTAVDRAMSTLVGGLFALLIFVLWPTWERSQVPDALATRLEALGQYGLAVTGVYVDPGASNRATIDDRHRAVRLARSNAETSVERSLQEPEPYRVNATIARGLLGAADTMAGSIITLDAYLAGNATLYPLSAVAVFGRDVNKALWHLAQAIREGQPVTTPLPMHETLHALEYALKQNSQLCKEAHTEMQIVLAEAKQIAHTVDSMYQLLSD